jgi:shikimate kinase
LKHNILLIGFMGTGKTAIGKRLASVLGMKFFDSDAEIEKVTGMPIAQVYRRYGEIRLKSEERLAIKRIAQHRNCVIAMGGSFLPDPGNIEALKQEFIVISLTARPEIIYERIKRRNNRPMVKKEDSMDKIVNMMRERDFLYRNADFQLDTSEMNFQQITQNILNYINAGTKGE